MIRTSALTLCVMLLISQTLLASDYVAVSLKQASQTLHDEASQAKQLAQHLAGITRPRLLIYDTKQNDMILVGECDDTLPQLTLDDWTVAIRSEFVVERDPVVSIDQTEDTPKTGNQTVRFEGALKDTQFGKDLLAADILLKHLALGKESATIFNVPSFLSLSADHYGDQADTQSDFTRFWFLPNREKSYVSAGDSVVFVQEYRLDVQNERYIKGKSTEEADPAVAGFSGAVRSNFGDLKTHFPALARMEQLYYLTALAQGLRGLGIEKSDSSLSYWLGDYKIRSVLTRPTYPLEQNTAEVKLEDGRAANLLLSGGIDLDALVIKLEDGTPDSLRDYVLATRPDVKSLRWDVPLVALSWSFDINQNHIEAEKKALSAKPHMGMAIQRQLSAFQQGRSFALKPTSLHIPSVPFQFGGISDTPRHEIRFNNHLRPTSSDIGGVLLRGAARVEGNGDDVAARLATGDFALILGDANSRLHPLAFKKFVTSLWCVYLGKTDPGISIDPIATGAKKQLVRYIGRVHNTDLARVMRDADYLMKQWAVGTARPNIDGFKSPDDYAAKRGTAYLNIMSRFWFVPKDMRFQSTGKSIVFLDGDMTVQTEFVLRGEQDVYADPANEDFARWFTQSYRAVSNKYPVYTELYDYAKLVALANYVNDSGVPLLWFVVAHRDLVLTEQSPGTVDALFADSKAIGDVRIEGGVDLASQPQYIMDAEARVAIAEAYASMDRCDAYVDIVRPPTSVKDTYPITERTGRMSIVPQHSSSSGVDYRGVRYQTDLSISEDGYRLNTTTEAELKREIQEHFLWIAMRPYLNDRKYSDGSVRNARTLEQMFAANWKTASNEAESVVRRLDMLRGRTYHSSHSFDEAVAAALGKETFADVGPVIRQAARFQHRFDLVRYCSLDASSTNTAFGQGWSLLVPYRLDFSEATKSVGQNARLPAQIHLVDCLHGGRETLNLQLDRTTGATLYVSDSTSNSLTLGLVVMADGGFRLEDKLGCRFEFNALGQMTSMTLSDAHQMDFVRKPLTKFERTPYKLSADADGGEVAFQGGRAKAPKQFQITDGDGRQHTFTFDNSRDYMVWKPKVKDGLFTKLLLMNGDTFHALDRYGAIIIFASNGDFEAIVPDEKTDCVSRLDTGTQRIDLTYDIAADGRLYVNEARAYLGESEDNPNYIVKYTYTADQQLVRRHISQPKGDALAWQTN